MVKAELNVGVIYLLSAVFCMELAWSPDGRTDLKSFFVPLLLVCAHQVSNMMLFV
jgi:hypothetical protein